MSKQDRKEIAREICGVFGIGLLDRYRVTMELAIIAAIQQRDHAAEAREKALRDAHVQIGWIYKVIVNKHVTGPPREGQIQINGVCGTPSDHIYFSTEPPAHEWMWWKSACFATNTDALSSTPKPASEGV